MNVTHLWIILGIVGMAVGIFALGWQARIMWADWQDDKALRAMEARYERHSHRKVPLARLADPEPLPGEWRFAGESAPGWAAESAEYELLTQTTEQPGVGSLDWTAQTLEQVQADERAEKATTTGEIQAITARVEGWIAQWTAQGNVDRHTIQASDG